jgi:hypothetical protein
MHNNPQGFNSRYSQDKNTTNVSPNKATKYSQDSTIINQIITEQISLENDVKQKVFKEVTPDNILEVVQSVKVTLNKDYVEPITCISIEGAAFATLGNFSAVIGKAKSRKTFFISLLLHSCLNKLNDGIIEARFPINKRKVIFIDTEQAPCHVVKVGRRILRENESAALDVYSLRSYSPKDRIKLIDHIIENTLDVGVVVIDGIRDLAYSINDEQEATEVVTLLLKWTMNKDIHIITVIHENKGDNNARGHLGAEVVNKAETVVSVEKDGDISIVSPKFCRDKDFNQFAFTINESGEPYFLDDWKGNEEASNKKKQSLTPRDIPDATHKKYLKSIFAANSSYSYRELQSAIINTLDGDGCKIGQSKSRDFITHYILQEWIIKDKIKSKSYEGYYLKPPC